jgi:CRISPR-associated exonuclease Cas4
LDHPINHLIIDLLASWQMLILYLAIFFLCVALVLFSIAARQKRHTGLPAGKIIYTDSSQWSRVEKPLFDPDTRLTGKPDYLVQQGDQVIPVEVKSRPALQAPYDSHIYQLAAYCILVSHQYNSRPSFGIIHYSNRSYAVDFTSSLESAVKSTIHDMQGKTARSQVNRSHDNPRICLHCGYRSYCDQSLRI